MTDRRRRWRWGAAMFVPVVLLAGCTTTTLNPTTSTAGSTVSVPTTPGSAGTTADATSASSDVQSSDVQTSNAQPSDVSVSVAAPSSESATTEPPTAAPTAAFTPATDAEAIEGACPYLSQDQVQADTGQRMGPTRIRPADPQPVCEFVRNDGDFLATVRVLQLDSEATAVGAVDFYVPRDGSNPESRPAGWSGGSLATDDGSRYAVSKGALAVIAETNQKQSVYARLLVVHAIENLGL